MAALALALTLAACGISPAAPKPPPAPSGPGFSITATPTTLPSTLGGLATMSVTLASQNGFTGDVRLQVLETDGQPSLAASLDPVHVTLLSGQTLTKSVTLSIASSVPAGTFDFQLAATSGGTTHTVPFSLGLGTTANGTFKVDLTNSYGLGSHPTSPVVVNVMGLGFPDVVVADDTSPGKVWVVPGLGDGTLDLANAVSFPTSDSPTSLVAADLNDDGYVDLATVSLDSYGYGVVSVLLNNGNGSFQTPKIAHAGRGSMQLVTADLNADGIPDLVTADCHDPGTVSVLLGNGDGTFPNDRGVAYPAGSFPCQVAVGDFNGDGILDLAAGNRANPGGTVSILLGNGDGTFGTATSFPAGNLIYGILAADIDNNGTTDLVFGLDQSSNQGYDVGALLGNGDGTFGALQLSGNGDQGGGGIAVGDVNGDGTLDVVMSAVNGNNSSVIDVLRGNRNGHFQMLDSNVVTKLAGPVALGDLDGDSQLDIVTARTVTGNGLQVLLGQ